MSSVRRSTRQRATILEALSKVHTHPTAVQIHAMVKKRMPRIGLATVYRNLDVLERQHQLLRLRHGKEARFDAHTAKHCHLICRECGDIADVFDVKKVTILSAHLKKTGFKPDLDYLEISGVCRKC